MMQKTLEKFGNTLYRSLYGASLPMIEICYKFSYNGLKVKGKNTTFGI